jgi:probable HAF family extracellular repeat protein
MGSPHQPLSWRRFCRALAVAVAAGLALAGGVPAAAEPAITATILLGLDGRSFVPVEMNERGEVLGVQVDTAPAGAAAAGSAVAGSPPAGRIVVWRDGVARPVAPGRVGLPLALNERGDVGGTLVAPGGRTEGFVDRARGGLTTMADPDPAVAVAVVDVDRFGDALIQRTGPDTTTTALLRHGHESILLLDRPNTAVLGGDINDRRRTAGAAGPGAFTTSQRRALVALGDLGGGEATAWAISDRGLVVGRSTDAAGQVRAVVWPVHQVQPVDLGTLGGPTSSIGLTTPVVPPALAALGGALNRHVVNAAGDVIGTSTVPGGGAHGFVWRAGRLTDLGTLPGCVDVQPTAVGERGDVVGLCTGPAGSRAFRWRDGRLLDLGATGEVGVPLDVDRGGRILAYHPGPGGDPVATLITIWD